VHGENQRWAITRPTSSNGDACRLVVCERIKISRTVRPGARRPGDITRGDAGDGRAVSTRAEPQARAIIGIAPSADRRSRRPRRGDPRMSWQSANTPPIAGADRDEAKHAPFALLPRQCSPTAARLTSFSIATFDASVGAAQSAHRANRALRYWERLDDGDEWGRDGRATITRRAAASAPHRPAPAKLESARFCANRRGAAFISRPARCSRRMTAPLACRASAICSLVPTRSMTARRRIRPQRVGLRRLRPTCPGLAVLATSRARSRSASLRMVCFDNRCRRGDSARETEPRGEPFDHERIDCGGNGRSSGYRRAYCIPKIVRIAETNMLSISVKPFIYPRLNPVIRRYRLQSFRKIQSKAGQPCLFTPGARIQQDEGESA